MVIKLNNKFIESTIILAPTTLGVCVSKGYPKNLIKRAETKAKAKIRLSVEMKRPTNSKIIKSIIILYNFKICNFMYLIY